MAEDVVRPVRIFVEYPMPRLLGSTCLAVREGKGTQCLAPVGRVWIVGVVPVVDVYSVEGSFMAQSVTGGSLYSSGRFSEFDVGDVPSHLDSGDAPSKYEWWNDDWVRRNPSMDHVTAVGEVVLIPRSTLER